MKKLRKIKVLIRCKCIGPFWIWTGIFILMIAAAASPQQKYSLIFSPRVGDRIIYTMNSTIQAEGKEFTGTEISLGVTASGDISFDVKRKVRDRVFTGLTTPGIHVEVQTIEGQKLYTLQTKKGQALQASFNTKGSLIEIHNLEAINRDEVMNISLAQIVRDFFPVLPGRPVSIGEIWIDNRQIDIPFQGIDLEVSIETTYTLQNVIPSAEGDMAVISLDYKVSLTGTEEMRDWTSSFEGKGTGGGFLNFLIQQRCFREFEVDYQTKASLVIKKEGKALMEWPFYLSVFASAVKTN